MASDWHETVPYDELGCLAVAALEGDTDPRAYLERTVDIAWSAARDLAEAAEARLVLVPGSPEAAAAAAYSDGSVHLGLPFVERAALESLCAAEERAIGFSRQVGYHSPPADIAAPADFATRVRDLDVLERSLTHPDGYAPDWEDHALHTANAVARGEHVPDLATRSRGLAALGLAPGGIRSGDLGLLHDPGWSEHILRLHHVGLVNLLVFTLVHECGHLRLGHLDAPAHAGAGREDLAEVRGRELEADRFALDRLTGRSDLPAALEALGLVHARERVDTDAASLTHPYSTVRLRLLAEAMSSSRADAALLDRVGAVLRTLRRRVGVVPFYTRDGSTQEVTVDSYGDLTRAFVEVRLREPAGTAVPDRPVTSSVIGIEVAYRGVRDDTVHARGYAAALFGPPLVSTSQLDQAGATMTHLMTLKLMTPPAWRESWPLGVLEVVAVDGKEAAAARLGRPAGDLVAALLGADQPLLWDRPVDELLGEPPGPDAVPDRVRERMYWCALLGRADEGFELAVRLVREAPAYAGFDLVLDTLEELQRRGRDAEVVELGLSYCEQLQVLRPRIHRVIGQAAEALGDVLLAHDQHFIDMHGFGSWSTVEEIVEHPMFEMLGRHRQDPIADTLLKAYAEAESGHRHARTPWGRRRKAWRLRLQVALLSWQLPERAAGLLSTRQLIAEGLSQLWRITGEDDVGELAQQQWSALVTDHPWWAPGWLQAAYFLDDRGATDLARESFLRAERIAPRSIQVTQGRERFFPRSETERARLAAFWKRFQQSTDEGIHQEEERA